MPPADVTRQCKSNRSVLRDMKDAMWMGGRWLGDLAAGLTSGEARTSSRRARRLEEADKEAIVLAVDAAARGVLCVARK
jgi:hypothetical protein